jgi:F0F1-type ATP synthase delta subunit
MIASRRKLAKTVVDRMETLGAKQALNELAAYILVHHLKSSVKMIVSDVEAELASRGRVVARVVSARPLDDELRASLRELVANHANATEVALHEELNPELIGGLQLSAAGYELDTSIASKIKQLSTL